ncbi:CBS domain-containing protein [Basilea psittacipulmonis]|uniref:CBS domain-containing protein n=1 Tax=Basilea psittacipulmonis DSM 24701 TaxID=1072685 RepID=A0A077DHC1_9BURK|nr:CBS domain-containing protein [Basilea psittacipulmonis]AIL32897.1 hypothetical protein IX83_05805 [Basilea psittacipulmonis DSM 24701]
MLKINEVLHVSSDILYVGKPEDSVQSAIDSMAKYHKGCILVMESGELVGIVTFFDIICLLSKKRGVVGDARLRSIMNDAPITVTPSTSVKEVQRLMLDHNVRYIPVLDGSKIIGVISIADVSRFLLYAEKYENNLLKAYIKTLGTDNEDMKEV